MMQSRQSGYLRRQGQLGVVKARLYAVTPAHRLEQLNLRRAALNKRLRLQMANKLGHVRQRLVGIGQHLQAVSPLATLGRGYAIVSQHPAGEILRSAAQVKPGEQIEARLAQGSLLCRVEKTEDDQ